MSPGAPSQEESDQICLYHIRKSCSFQGKLEALLPSRGRESASRSWNPYREEGPCQTSSESVLLRMEGIIWIFENEGVDKLLGI